MRHTIFHIKYRLVSHKECQNKSISQLCDFDIIVSKDTPTEPAKFQKTLKLILKLKADNQIVF